MTVQLIRKVRDRQPTHVVKISSEFAAKKPLAAFLPGISNREIVRGIEFLPNNGPTKNNIKGMKTLVSTASGVSYQGIYAPENGSGSRSDIFYDPVSPPITLVTISTGELNNSSALIRANGSGGAAFSCGAWYGSNSGGFGTVRTSGGSVDLSPSGFTVDTRYVPVVTVLSIGSAITSIFCGQVGGNCLQESSASTPSGNFYYEYGDIYRLLSVGGNYASYSSNTALAAMFGIAFSADVAKSIIANPWQIFEPETIPLFYTAGTGPVTHPTTGDVVGNTSTVTGTAARSATVQTHPSTGAVVGNTATVNGTVLRYRAHATTGAVTGLTSAVTGTAKRYRLHTTTGAVTGLTSTVTGSATIQPAPGIHVTSGDVVAGVGTVTGSALHVGVHATNGVLAGFSAEVVGAAQRSGAVIVHSTSGVLAGYDSVVTGAATNQGSMTLTPADIQAIVAAIKAEIMPVNIVRVNNIDVDGTGVAGDEWGPV